MYVSSFSAFAHADIAQKTQKKEIRQSKNNTHTNYAEKLHSQVSKSSLQQTTLPINYISDYKVLSNQQKLLYDNKNTQKTLKFFKVKALKNAHTAYSDNSKLFSFMIEPKQTLTQTSQVNRKLPSEFQKIQEKLLRTAMVNTYQANENYYKITSVA